MLRARWRVVGAALALVASGLAACGTSDTVGESSNTSDCPAPAFLNLTGAWSVEDLLEGDCLGAREQYRVEIEQLGEVLEIGGRTTFTAFLCGARARIEQPFAYERQDGVHTVDRLEITFTSPTAFEGTTRWEWRPSSGVGTCRGTSEISGVR